MALIGGGGLVEWAQAARYDARVAAYDDVPYVAGPLREPPVERWRGGLLVSWAGDVVIARPAASSDTIEARALADGALRWTRAVPDGYASCPHATRDGALLVCEVRAGLLVLDADDGTTVREVGAGDAWTMVDDDLVRAAVDGSDVLVRRSDTATGEVRWSAELRDVVPAEGARGVRVGAHGDLVLVGGSVAAALDADDGAVLAARGGEPGAEAIAAPAAGGFVLATSQRSSTWFDAAGRAGAELPGGPVPVLVDDSVAADGSASVGASAGDGVVLVTDADRLRAVDVRAGRTLWERPAVSRALLRLGDRLLLETEDAHVAVDLRTGAQAWSLPRDPLLSLHDLVPVTDGVRVALLEYDAADGYRAAAYDLDDGTRRWAVPLPDGTGSLNVTAAGDVLAGWAPFAVLE
ncbi:PQQ-binding-like beta-propeller repeat protein [Cellulomonas sp. APG4]|nr:PQQ-binding-like beta-propeller repeat protein [Cellulomonas sp. APG4]